MNKHTFCRATFTVLTLVRVVPLSKLKTTAITEKRSNIWLVMLDRETAPASFWEVVHPCETDGGTGQGRKQVSNWRVQ
jgi:hypothetical protein